jgi:hypothetical protein
MYKRKYEKYKSKYLELKQRGGNNSNFIILHNPNPSQSRTDITKQYNNIVPDLDKLGKVYNYFFKFGSLETDFILEDIQFQNVALDIYNKYKNLDKLFIICFEESAPYGLYFANEYPNKCEGIICFPLRLNTKESLERYIWKYKEKKGWEKYVSQKYDLDNYLLDINNDRLSEIQKNKTNKEESFILYSIMNYNLRKQYDKIPTIFKVPTCLFTRLDISAKGVLERNFERKSIADMKENVTKDDAFFNSMMWNFARVQYDEDLVKLNKDNKNLRIQYITADQESINLDLLDKVKIMIKKC